MATSDKLNYLIETKSAIKNAITAKGVEVSNTDTFRSYADKIGQISGGTLNSSNNEYWNPEPDWWDIDKILEEDTENVGTKAIILLTDEPVEYSNAIQGASKYKFSDGQIIETENVWDSVEINISEVGQKMSSKGYKTTYVICYFRGDSENEISLPRNSLYVIFDNLIPNADSHITFSDYLYLKALKLLNGSELIYHDGYDFQEAYSLQSVIGGKITCNSDKAATKMFYNSRAIRTVPTIDVQNKSINSLLYGCGAIDKVKLENTGGTGDFTNAFAHCYGLEEIDGLDFNSANNVSTMFNSCFNLKYLKNISNIKTRMDLTASKKLLHQSLMNIVNALVETETSKTILIGSENLAKLTESERLMIFNKGWVVS